MKCYYCNNKEIITYCKFCKEDICINHLIPENHNCKGLKDYMSNKIPKVEIYEDVVIYFKDKKELIKLNKNLRKNDNEILLEKNNIAIIIPKQKIPLLKKVYRKMKDMGIIND